MPRFSDILTLQLMKGGAYIGQATNWAYPATKKWTLGRTVRLQTGTQEHLRKNTRGGIASVE